ncbi:hypothetical protein QEZ52_14205 [Aliisedimentitalea scapharcae]|uniref:SRPBCC family protein n=1 Tax=Aliisedimentitalea scapharcae TaxID=1524259 RepID=A0ABZ2XQY4_9RHOB|nr:hypothetical protein K3727_14105 [Rhodobacteraceae bacterium M382]
MPRTLTFEHRYPVDPDRLFALVTDLDTLDAVTKPWVQFDHLPSGPVQAGQVIDVAISVFGIFPRMPYRMRVVSCDPKTRCMTSDEDGFGVHRLVHSLQVHPDPLGSRLLDRIEIDAGWSTPLVAAWAWVIYRWRHHVRLRLLQTG